jgi:hypothetical protein
MWEACESWLFDSSVVAAKRQISWGAADKTKMSEPGWAIAGCRPWGGLIFDAILGLTPRAL